MEMKKYEMFTKEGDNLVHKLINRVLKLPITAKDQEIYSLLTDEFNLLEVQGHGEVWDTACREQIMYAIENKTGRSLSVYF